MTQAKDTNPKDALAGDKVPLDLVPMTAIAMAALAHLDGATKYGRWNWRISGVRASIYLGALRRHVAAWENGEENAPDGVAHLGHALACLNILVDAQAVGKLTDDRPPSFDFTAWLGKAITPWVARIKERYKDRPVPKHCTISDGTWRWAPPGRPEEWKLIADNVDEVRKILRGDQPCRYEADLGVHMGQDDKTAETCRTKFDNLKNFPGLPEIPGTRKVTSKESPTTRLTVYLAGPMRGIPEYNFPRFKSAAEFLRSMGYEVVSPAEHDESIGFDAKTGDGDQQFKKSIGWDMEQILDSVGIMLLDGWENSKGARLEAAVAHHAGKAIYRLQYGDTGWSMPYRIFLKDPVVLHGGGSIPTDQVPLTKGL